ncbi:hypothetical protein [Nocardia sp. IFM 10818]
MLDSAAESASTAPAVMRYLLFIPVPSLPEDDCDDLALQVVVHGPVVPRAGERIEFDGPKGRALALTVSEVEHVFSCEQAQSRVVVTAELEDTSVQYGVARELLDLATWKRWVDHFPMLELPEHLHRCL